MASNFFWYELMTSDLPAAETFYKAVIGWTTEDFPGDGPRYLVLKAGERGVGGLMTIPAEAARGGAKPAWLGYIHSRDTDATVQKITAAGGKLHRGPENIPGVGRFAVLADSQGAMFMLLQPDGPDQPPVPPGTLGHVGWHELLSANWQKAFDFYSSQFGWTKDEAIDMGEMGTYQLYAVNGVPSGGMMNCPPYFPSHWGFYFFVDGIDAAAGRVKQNGGQITFGPMEVPGGQWVANCMDPQGAHFSLVSNTK